MRELKPNELATIDTLIDGLRSSYNAFKIEPCDFAGAPDDFASLDFIPYELPMSEKHAEGSLAFAMAWGNVLAKSFGFTWVTGDHFPSPESFALWHDDPRVLVFPFFRLLEITESSGAQHTPAQTLWFEIVHYQDKCTYAAEGWHPVFDAVQCPKKLGCTASTTDACQQLIDTVPDFMFRMSTYPYRYTESKDWKKLADYANRISESHVRNRRGSDD